MRRTIATAAALLACALSGCAERIGSPYRVKITLEALVQGQPRTTSQVLEIQHYLCRQSFCAPRQVSGDSFAFDYGDRGLLVAQLDGKIAWLLYAILDAQRQGLKVPRDTFPRSADEARLLDTAHGIYPFDPTLQFNSWLVLTDPEDPSSGRHVDLMGSAPNTFADEFTLVRASIAKTTEPVTRGLLQRLPWLSSLNGGSIEIKDHERITEGVGSTHVVREHLVMQRD